MSKNGYPRLLYKPGSEEIVWGIECDLLRVHSDEEEAAALADGWFEQPIFDAPEPLSLLDKPVAEIVPLLADLTRDELVALITDERAGKTRKSLMAALEDAIAAKEAQ